MQWGLTTGASLPLPVKTGEPERTDDVVHDQMVVDNRDGTTSIHRPDKGTLTVPTGHGVLESFLKQLDVWWADLEGVASTFAQKLPKSE
jgi:hypothetical protein